MILYKLNTMEEELKQNSLLNSIEGLIHYVNSQDKLKADKVLLEYLIRLEITYYENLIKDEHTKQLSKN